MLFRACSAHFLVQTRTSLGRCPPWAGPSHISHPSGKWPPLCPQTQRMGRQLHSQGPASQVTLTHVKWTNTNRHTGIRLHRSSGDLRTCRDSAQTRHLTSRRSQDFWELSEVLTFGTSVGEEVPGFSLPRVIYPALPTEGVSHQRRHVVLRTGPRPHRDAAGARWPWTHQKKQGRQAARGEEAGSGSRLAE